MKNLLIILSLLLITSCTKSNDVIVECPQAMEGIDCETPTRSLIRGLYTAVDSNESYNTGEFNPSITENSSLAHKILLVGFARIPQAAIKAEISGKYIEIPYQEVIPNLYIQGIGTIVNSNEIQWKYILVRDDIETEYNSIWIK